MTEQEKQQQQKQTKEKEPQLEEKKEEPKEERKLPDIQPGMVIKVHQKITDTDTKGNPRERIQIFEGIVIARKSGNQPGATFRVRKIATGGVGVEKIFPLHSPSILKVEIVKKNKVKRAKLYFLRNYRKKLKEVKE